jgi:hypothetical protein
MWYKIVNWAIIFFATITVYSQSPLCTSYPTSFCCEYVASVTINGMTFNGSTGFAATSGGTGPNGYYDYTNQLIPTINAGDQITISYTAKTNSNYMEYFKLWFDFNGNGVLSDAGELVHEYNFSWNGTHTKTATFTVPTTVFNGQVYLRFMMVYANVPALCGTYAYGNTFDFRTTITGAISPYNHSGFIYGSEGIGIANVPVKLFKKLTSETTYTLHGTYNTNANGQYSIVTNLNAPLYNFQIVVDALTVVNPSISDAQFFNQKVLNQNFSSKDYYRMDINQNGLLSITDVYLDYLRIFNLGFPPNTPIYRIFTSPQWTTINSSTSNLTSSLPGVQSLTINNPTNSSTTNLYLIRTGYAN